MSCISYLEQIKRPRRLRSHPQLRALVREIKLSCTDFVTPLFIREGKGTKRAISSMPGYFQLTLDDLEEELDEILSLGLTSLILFGIPGTKDAIGSSSLGDENIIAQAIRRVKELAPELLLITDNCLCDYTDHGHCGPIDSRGSVDNDATLEILAEQALSYAKAGADMLAPSGMIDGMVGAMRQALDREGYSLLPIMSYSVKYASGLYAPFREAAESTPRFGDRKGYQMDSANSAEALRETALDLEEGADILMVKPAHTYLDVIYRVKQAHPEIPLAAYHTSGEFALIKAAAAQGWLDEKKIALEVHTAIKRAGADFIITYFSKQLAHWLADKN